MIPAQIAAILREAFPWKCLLGATILCETGERLKVLAITERNWPTGPLIDTANLESNNPRTRQYNIDVFKDGYFLQIFLAVEIENDFYEKYIDKEKLQNAYKQLDESIARKLRRLDAIQSLQFYLSSEFATARINFDINLRNILSEDDFLIASLEFVQAWAKKHGYGQKLPDEEQARAISALDRHILLVARAGSGKTTTLVNRALFLIGKCGVQPHEIMLLAFNRKAAEEIRERLSHTLSGAIPHVMTFHALAYALVHPDEALVYDDPEGSAQKTQVMQMVIDDFRRSDLYRDRIRNLMLSHFRGEWEKDIRGGWDKSPEEALDHRRNKIAWESIDGKAIKSFGEKLIADFLFEHDVRYWYEPNRKWNGRNYRPDFLIPTGSGQGVVVEYFGLAGDPDYDRMSNEKRAYWEQQKGYSLLEYMPSDIASSGPEAFLQKFEVDLVAAGVPCRQLSEAEIWVRIERRALTRFDRIMESLVGRFRKLNLDPPGARAFLQSQGRHQTIEPMAREFLDLGITFFEGYLARLEATGKEDFDGLMIRAAGGIQAGRTRFQRKSSAGDLRNLKHLLIDEYQDFSQLFQGVVVGMQSQAPELNVFCVGDNWQAINGFAGSDLKFFQSFSSYFTNGSTLPLRTNYRSGKTIVELGNNIMRDKGIAAIAHRQHLGQILVADLEDFQPTEGENTRYPGVDVLPAAIRLAWHFVQKGKRVVFLNRTNNSAYYTPTVADDDELDPRSLRGFLECIHEALPENYRPAVTISTAHQYKGKEEEVVVILDALNRRYPLIHPDYKFFEVLGDSEQSIIEDERRLFYVATTRAKDTLILMTERQKASPFLKWSRLEKVVWGELRPPTLVTSRSHLILRVRQQDKRPTSAGDGWGTHPVKDFLKADHFQWRYFSETSQGTLSSKTGYWWRKTTRESFNLEHLRASLWSREGRGLCLTVCTLDEKVIAEFLIERGDWTCCRDDLGLTGVAPEKEGTAKRGETTH